MARGEGSPVPRPAFRSPPRGPAAAAVLSPPGRAPSARTGGSGARAAAAGAGGAPPGRHLVCPGLRHPGGTQRGRRRPFAFLVSA